MGKGFLELFFVMLCVLTFKKCCFFNIIGINDTWFWLTRMFKIIHILFLNKRFILILCSSLKDRIWDQNHEKFIKLVPAILLWVDQIWQSSHCSVMVREFLGYGFVFTVWWLPIGKYSSSSIQCALTMRSFFFVKLNGTLRLRSNCVTRYH